MNSDEEALLIKKVIGHPWNLMHIEGEQQTEEICLAAVKRDATALQFVENQTEKVCLAAIDTATFALRMVKNQTEKICSHAVKKNGLALQYVDNQTNEICLEAVKENPDAFEYVKLNYMDKEKKNIALIALNSILQQPVKNKQILTKIINKFEEDKEIIDFYTKHKLWKDVDFSKFDNELLKHSMTI